MIHDCFEVETISKGHKARKYSQSIEAKRKLRESLKIHYNAKVANSRKYPWEALTLERPLILKTDATPNSVRCSAYDWARRRNMEISLKAEAIIENGRSYVKIWRVK